MHLNRDSSKVSLDDLPEITPTDSPWPISKLTNHDVEYLNPMIDEDDSALDFYRGNNKKLFAPLGSTKYSHFDLKQDES